jgi:hypothetical protein
MTICKNPLNWSCFQFIPFKKEGSLQNWEIWKMFNVEAPWVVGSFIQ